MIKTYSSKSSKKNKKNQTKNFLELEIFPNIRNKFSKQSMCLNDD